MSMEINSVGQAWNAAQPEQQITAEDTQVRRQVVAQQVAEANRERERRQVDIRSAIRELEQVSSAFNKRLKFSLNEEIDQVVVKVIDARTDKVIKELPPRELQRVYARIREALGLLFDTQI